ncbi:MAG: MATE family efflux transporter [Lachnospiraceae bacterium]|nr:MATE family efflux transporter [Lachnospiraceae bacterium]
MEQAVNKSESVTQYDRMTKTPIPKLVVKLGIPTTISMLVTHVYNMVDTFFVGKLGTSASGATGIVFGFMAILQAVGFMLGQGAGSLISRRLGKKDASSAGVYASTSFFLALFSGVLIEILGLCFLEPMLKMLGSTDTILPYARQYVWYILLASPFMVASFVMNNILRFEGKAAYAMCGLMAGALLNMGCDPLFMFVFDMGIAGAGLATALSQCISFCILLFMFLSGKTQSRLSIRSVTRDMSLLGNLLATGLPAMLRQGMSSIATMLLNHCAKEYGDPAVAAMSIVSRITMLIFAVGLGVGQGFQPVCGFNYGAGKYKRVRKAYGFTLALATVMLGSFALVGLLTAPWAVRVFRDDDKVVEIGTLALRLQCGALFFQPLMVMTNMLLQSTGKKLLAAFTALLRSGLYFIPVLLVLVHYQGLFGVQAAQPIADVLAFLTALPIVIWFFARLPKEDADAVEKLAALTFDDGPSAGTTMEVLSVLEEFHEVGTFFLIGQNINEQTEKSVKRALALGCEIENHSWSHSAMPELSPEQMREEVVRTTQEIVRLTGRKPIFFRPPYIAVSDEMYRQIPLTFIAGVGCEDWNDSVSAEERAGRIQENVRDGAVILLHDMEGNHQTVEALRLIIPRLRKMGYRFVTLEQLFREKGVVLNEDVPAEERRCFWYAEQTERWYDPQAQ